MKQARYRTVGEPAERFSYPTDLDVGQTVRSLLFEHASAHKKQLNFLDIGGRDGSLKYLFGSTKGRNSPKNYERNKKRFFEFFNYYGCDLMPRASHVLAGDVCLEGYLSDKAEFLDFFDVIYSNNTFEHLARPWITVRHIDAMLKRGGMCITVAPFAQRYHQAPEDFFRYTHKAIESLFRTETKMVFEVLCSGYDLYKRRWDVYGHKSNALPPDELGGWRETWVTVTALRKL